MLIILGYIIAIILVFLIAACLVSIILGVTPGDSNQSFSRSANNIGCFFFSILLFLCLIGLQKWLNLGDFFWKITLGLGLFFFGTMFWGRLTEIKEGNKLAKQAIKLQAEDSGNPFETKFFLGAIELYKKCNQLIYNSKFRQTIKNLEEEIERRNQFQKLFKQGRSKVKKGYFQEALLFFKQAKHLYAVPRLESEIINCHSQVQKEENYTTQLNQATAIAKEGKFIEAIILVEEALTKFSRSDGENLLEKLEQIVKGKKIFFAGLKQEKVGQLEPATIYYKQAIKIIPELTEAFIRLGILAIKKQDFTEALYHLKDLSGAQAAYLRGLAYAHQKNWQQAQREWKSLHNFKVQEQCQTLKALAQWERLSMMRLIERHVDNEELQQAQSNSLNFLQLFGADSIVEGNLVGHIQPRLEAQIWETKDWQQIATLTEQIWLKQQDITALHNWAVAVYHQSLSHPNHLSKLIAAWSTALANIKLNPFLKNLPWLLNTSIDIDEISQRLTKLLEDLIDEVKEQDITKYFPLRDSYRLDSVALRFMKEDLSAGVRVKQLLITPSCYQHHRHQFPSITLSSQLWAALYTDWGKAVAACLEGDSARAIEIKPTSSAQSVVEKLGYSFVSYHEGCYYLQQYNWRKAVPPLKQAKTEIQSNSDWQEEIERLFRLQRQKIDDFEEHLELAQFWSDSLPSLPAKAYLAEYKAKQIGYKLADKRINNQQALSELKNLQKIDANNPIVQDLIDRIEYTQEAEKIQYLMQQGRVEEAIQAAKRSHHRELRQIVAEICFEIVMTDLERQTLPREELRRLVRWMYELCPDDPNFQEFYRIIGLI